MKRGGGLPFAFVLIRSLWMIRSPSCSTRGARAGGVPDAAGLTAPAVPTSCAPLGATRPMRRRAAMPARHGRGMRIGLTLEPHRRAERNAEIPRVEIRQVRIDL